MTRPKVAPEARQRTAQACESCKRRKQKCNGLTPCVTCAKRKFDCIYYDRVDPKSPSSSATPHPAKRRMTDENFGAQSRAANGDGSPPNSNSPSHQRQSSFSLAQRPQTNFSFVERPSVSNHTTSFKGDLIQASDESTEAARSLQQFSAPRVDDQSAKQPQSGNANGLDEEAVVYSQTRMLQDPTGRLLYVGDSATLSFLQLIRMMVESVGGQSPFTTDPRRHKIMESQFSLPPNSRNTHLIPDQVTALVLAESFFTNTQGMVQVFERKPFLQALETTYSDPLSVEPNWLCLLNLVFAIGLMMAVATPGTREAAVIERLQNEHLDRAELFYLNAKSLNDPIVGLEDADFWSVQALLLMTVYMLAKSKRNTAFALLGMAIRSSYALGLHREETLMIFSDEEQISRRSVWKSLFVMDRFLSCSLGRPPGISEDDCSGDTLKPQDLPPDMDDMGFSLPSQNNMSLDQTSKYGLDAAVRSCSAIGAILKRVYQKRKISTRLAQEIADICKVWPKALAPMLHWRQASNATPSQGIAILHANLLYCHSIILLTRPFFLFILNDVLQQVQAQGVDIGSPSRRNYAKMEKFSEACVVASTHTVVLVQNAFEASHLPRRNPFVIYFLFAAALIMLSNEYALLYRNHAADQCIRNSITIMAYCAETDPQASRLLYILTTFRDVVMQERQKRALKAQEAMQLPPFNTNNVTSRVSGGQIPPNNGAGLQQTQATINLPPVTSTSAFYSDQLQGQATNIQQQDFLQNRSQMSPVTHPTTSSSNSTMQSQPSIITTQPIEPSLNSPAPPNPLSPHPSNNTNLNFLTPLQNAPQITYPPVNPLVGDTGVVNAPGGANQASGQQTPVVDREISFTNIFDFAAMNSTRLSVSEESSGPDEHIDFDALWAWPSNTPAMGTPGAGIGQSGTPNPQGN